MFDQTSVCARFSSRLLEPDHDKLKFVGHVPGPVVLLARRV
jgi:hypothetical protein